MILTAIFVRTKEMKGASMIIHSRLFALLIPTPTCVTSSLVLTLKEMIAEKQTQILFLKNLENIMGLDQGVLLEKSPLEDIGREISATNLFVMEM